MLSKALEIVSYTPVYIWVLAIYLLWSGWKARKTYKVSWKTLFIMPAMMFMWSLYSMFIHKGMISICLWPISVTLGVWLGVLTIRRLKLRFDKRKKLIEISGSWIPIILSISIFSLKYFLGALSELHPELVGSMSLLSLQNIATILSGMFIGRLIGYWQRSKTSLHIDLSKTKA